MRNKFVVFAILLLVIPCLGAAAAAKKPRPAPTTSAALQPSIPVYPKGKVTMEINLSKQDLLPLIQGTLFAAMREAAKAESAAKQTPEGAPKPEGTQSVVPDMSAMGIDEAAVDELEAALAGLNKVSVVGYTVPTSVQPEKLADFYFGKMGLGSGWNKLFQGVFGKGLVMVYAKPNAESVFGLMVGPKDVTVARTFGRIDIAAITKLINRIIAAGIRQATTTPAPEQQPTPAPEPAPAAAPAQ